MVVGIAVSPHSLHIQMEIGWSFVDVSAKLELDCLKVYRRSCEGVVVGSFVSLFVNWFEEGKNGGVLFEGVQYLPLELEERW